MPLGKLSKRQIQSAYALLTEVQQVSNQQPLLDGRLTSHLSVGSSLLWTLTLSLNKIFDYLFVF